MQHATGPDPLSGRLREPSFTRRACGALLVPGIRNSTRISSSALRYLQGHYFHCVLWPNPQIGEPGRLDPLQQGADSGADALQMPMKSCPDGRCRSARGARRCRSRFPALARGLAPEHRARGAAAYGRKSPIAATAAPRALLAVVMRPARTTKLRWCAKAGAGPVVHRASAPPSARTPLPARHR